MKGKIVLSVLLLLWPGVLWAKAAGDALEQYLNAPRLTESKEVLALVEVTNVSFDRAPEKGWLRTGTLTLRTVETVGGPLPSPLRVRFYLRQGREDQWTWDDVELGRGRRLLGFFNHWSGSWEVTRDGKTGIIQNVERIRPVTRTRVQKQFKTPLLPMKKPQNVGLPNNPLHPTRH